MTPQEKLEEIEGWPDYGVNALGQVYSFKRKIWLKQYKNLQGYFRVNLRSGIKRKQWPINSLVLETFIGPRPQGFEAAHLNGNKTDNRLEKRSSLQFQSL